eukprot:XP_001690928.1 predicted protein [Chlamydomonas reinhardtii]
MSYEDCAGDPFISLLLERRPELEALLRGQLQLSEDERRAAPKKTGFSFGGSTALPRLGGTAKLSVKARIAGGEPWTRPEPWPIVPVACATASAAEGHLCDSEGEEHADADDDTDGGNLKPSDAASPVVLAAPAPAQPGAGGARSSGDASSCGSCDSRPPHSLSTIATSCLDAINSPDAGAVGSPKPLLVAASSSPQCHRGGGGTAGGGAGAVQGQCGSPLRRVVMHFDGPCIAGRGATATGATALASGLGAAPVVGAGTASSYLLAVPGGTPVFCDSPTRLPGRPPEEEPGQANAAAAVGLEPGTGVGAGKPSRTAQLVASWPVDNSGGGRLAPLTAQLDGPANARPMPPAASDRAAQLSLRIQRLQQQHQHMLEARAPGSGSGGELLPPPPALAADPLAAAPLAADDMPPSLAALLDPMRLAASSPTLARQETLGGAAGAKALVGSSRGMSPVPWEGGPPVAELDADTSASAVLASHHLQQHRLQQPASAPHVSHQMLELPLRRSSLQQQQQQQPSQLVSMMPRRGCRPGDGSYVVNTPQRLQQQAVMGTAGGPAGGGPYAGIVGHKARSQPQPHVAEAEVLASPVAARSQGPGLAAGFPAQMRRSDASPLPRPDASTGSGLVVGSTLAAGITARGVAGCAGAYGSGAASGATGTGGSLPSVHGALPVRRRASDYGGSENGLLAAVEEANRGVTGDMPRPARPSSDGGYLGSSSATPAATARRSILGNVADGGVAGIAATTAGPVAGGSSGLSGARAGVAAFGRASLPISYGNNAAAATTTAPAAAAGSGTRATSNDFLSGLMIAGNTRPAVPSAAPAPVLPSLKNAHALRSSAASLPIGATAGGSGGGGSAFSGAKSPHRGLLRAVLSEKQLGASSALASYASGEAGTVPTAAVVTATGTGKAAGEGGGGAGGSPRLLPGGFSGGTDMMVTVLGDFSAVPDLARSQPRACCNTALRVRPEPVAGGSIGGGGNGGGNSCSSDSCSCSERQRAGCSRGQYWRRRR